AGRDVAYAAATAATRSAAGRSSDGSAPRARGIERFLDQGDRGPPAVGRVEQDDQHAHAVALRQAHEALAGLRRGPGLDAGRTGVRPHEHVAVLDPERPAAGRADRGLVDPDPG